MGNQKFDRRIDELKNLGNSDLGGGFIERYGSKLSLSSDQLFFIRRMLVTARLLLNMFVV